jgi:hypothetical protein
VSGTIDLPVTAPPKPPDGPRGFLDRAENASIAIKPFDPTPYFVVVLTGGTPPDGGTPGTSWDLVGESFARPLIAVRAGAEVTVKNKSKRAVTVQAVEDPKLVPVGPINPSGSRAFTPKTAGLVTLTDPDIPHLRGRLVVVETPYVALVDRDRKFTVKGVPPGDYKVRIWYLDGWLDRPDDTVTVGAKGNATLSPKLTGYKAKAN